MQAMWKSVQCILMMVAVRIRTFPSPLNGGSAAGFPTTPFTLAPFAMTMSWPRGPEPFQVMFTYRRTIKARDEDHEEAIIFLV